MPVGIPPDHLVYHVQTPRCRFEPVLQGIRARPLCYLLEDVRIQSLLPPGGFPVKPSVQTTTCNSDQSVANGRIRTHQFTHDGSYPPAILAPAAGNQDVPGLAGGAFLIMRQMVTLLASGKNSPPFGIFAPL